MEREREERRVGGGKSERGGGREGSVCLTLFALFPFAFSLSLSLSLFLYGVKPHQINLQQQQQKRNAPALSTAANWSPLVTPAKGPSVVV